MKKNADIQHNNDGNCSDFGNSFYLNYGEEKLDSQINLKSVLNYLDRITDKKNILSEARNRQVFTGYDDKSYFTRYCDCCGRPMMETGMEKMPDGRIRCEQCATDQVSTEEDFKKIYDECRKQFCSFYETVLPDGIRAVLSTNCIKTDHRAVLNPSENAEIELRMGIVRKENGQYLILVESGISVPACRYALISAFTLIWQDQNWDLNKLRNMCVGMAGDNGDAVYRAILMGMREWAATSYFYLVNDKVYGSENDEMNQNDHHPESAAYPLFKKTYPYHQNPKKVIKNPFHPQVPIDIRALIRNMSANNFS